jgi:hypothetical protein
MAKLNFKKIMEQVTKKAPGLALGAIASTYVGKGIDMAFGKDDGTGVKKANPYIAAGMQVVAGALIPGFLNGGKKDDLIQAIGDGVMAQGAVQLAKALKVPGIGAIDDDPISGVYGIPEDHAAYLSGTDTSNSISGAQD